VFVTLLIDIVMVFSLGLLSLLLASLLSLFQVIALRGYRNAKPGDLGWNL
jgi:hypothetical protein